jgi:hypothetical protein
LISHASFLFEKSIGIRLAVWAVRYNAEWDYKLSARARAVRWTIVTTGYLLVASFPGPGCLRVIAIVIALSFLCWPNFAYHLTNAFVEWPRAEGRVVSSTKFDGDSVVSYVFHLGDQTFGRYARVKASGVTKTYSNDEKVTIAYDPLNPDQSKLVL